MTLLHDYFNLRNQQAFQRLLDSNADRGSYSTGLSTSGGKSWNRSGTLTSTMSLDINARDWLGRTVLHLACASPESLEYVRLLLRHPSVNVNIGDTESHWTPLHRALYHGNLPAALLLLQRTDTDKSLQDLEGYTAFDLFNSTINGTRPCRDEAQAELYTWGTNRNAALGLGDEGDRTYPDRVIIQNKDVDGDCEKGNIRARFSPIFVRQIQMSKLHTVAVTCESGGNIRVCGFGSGGRLGPSQHTQYSFKPLPQFSHTIIAVAMGQDHTLALTKAGEVLSWGLNRFSQLGYIVDNILPGEGFGRIGEPIQATPRKVHGPLRKEIVIGIAASKGASACWTNGDVYTWGTNNGQLGYDKIAQPVQVPPRKATKLVDPVIGISLTDSAMVCLLDTQDVVVIWNDRLVKITFPGHAFPSEMLPYRPPQALQDAKIAKVTSCDDVFAALSLSGELFTFSVPNISENDGASGKDRPSFKPQRVWALRKKFSAVKDVALGSEGSIIVCTESGHVFVRTRNTKAGPSTSNKTFKFQRVPFIQRITQVCANSTGAFGALRVEYRPKPIEIRGNTIAEDLAQIQPYLKNDFARDPERQLKYSLAFPIPIEDHVPDDEADDINVISDIKRLLLLFDVITQEKERKHKSGLPSSLSIEQRHPHGADVLVIGQSGVEFPAHQVILGARSSVLRAILKGLEIRDRESGIFLRLLGTSVAPRNKKLVKLGCNGCQPLSILILLEYLYSDELLAVWDGRVSGALREQLTTLRIQPARVKLELISLARLLQLPLLVRALEPPVKLTPVPSMVSVMTELFKVAQTAEPTQPTPDVILILADKEIRCYSAILRARSIFFASFFDDDDWTANRWDANGIITVDMKHLPWRVMKYVLDFMCCGEDSEMFDTLDFTNSIDDVLEFMFDVMAAANELLLDRLVLLCSDIILAHSNISNACYILSDATYLHAEQLIERLQSFITVNMDLFLESGMLEDVPAPLIKQLAGFSQQKQAEKSPISRSNCLALEALKTHADWLALQDIPSTIHRTTHALLHKSSTTKLSSSGSGRRNMRLSTPGSPHSSPAIPPQRVTHHPHSSDDIFVMDDDVPPSLSLDSHHAPTSRSSNPATNTTPVWKAPIAPRVDMKAVIAETANIAITKRNSLEPRSFSWSTEKLPNQSIGAGPPQSSTPTRRPTGDVLSKATSLPSKAPDGKEPHSISSRNPKSPPPHTPPRSSKGMLPGLGPVITPTRQPPSINSPPSSIRRASGKAWNQLPNRPLVTTPSVTHGMSFAAIQQLQSEQTAGPSKDRRSLREIQEEERSLQEEADFLAWWTAEEMRIKEEAEAAAAAAAAPARGDRNKQPRRRSGKSADQTITQTTQDRPRRQPRKPNRQGKTAEPLNS